MTFSRRVSRSVRCCCHLADTSITAYGRHIKDTTIPVVNVGTQKNPTYLPAEVCVVEPGQSADARLSSTQTQNMIKFAVRKPGANAHDIANLGLDIVGLTGNNTFLVMTPSIDWASEAVLTVRTEPIRF